MNWKKRRTEEVQVASDILYMSGKPFKVVGKLIDLPLDSAAEEHFKKHRYEYVWRTTPAGGATIQGTEGLTCAIHFTDKLDHVPMIFMSDEVMEHIKQMKN